MPNDVTTGVLERVAIGKYFDARDGYRVLPGRSGQTGQRIICGHKGKRRFDHHRTLCLSHIVIPNRP